MSLRESIDTTTPGSELVLHVFGAVAEFEQDLTPVRTMAGLEVARDQRREDGRKPVMDEAKIALASPFVRYRKTAVTAVCEAVGFSRATLYRYVEADGTPQNRR